MIRSHDGQVFSICVSQLASLTELTLSQKSSWTILHATWTLAQRGSLMWCPCLSTYDRLLSRAHALVVGRRVVFENKKMHRQS